MKGNKKRIYSILLVLLMIFQLFFNFNVEALAVNENKAESIQPDKENSIKKPEVSIYYRDKKGNDYPYDGEKWSDLRNGEIIFKLVSTNDDEIKYQFKLEGDDDWKDIGSEEINETLEGELAIKQIKGKYIFRAISINDSNEFSEEVEVSVKNDMSPIKVYTFIEDEGYTQYAYGEKTNKNLCMYFVYNMNMTNLDDYKIQYSCEDSWTDLEENITDKKEVLENIEKVNEEIEFKDVLDSKLVINTSQDKNYKFRLVYKNEEDWEEIFPLDNNNYEEFHINRGFISNVNINDGDKYAINSNEELGVKSFASLDLNLSDIKSILYNGQEVGTENFKEKLIDGVNQSIKFIDKFGNESEERKFSIDRIKPKIEIEYDNKESKNEKYYNKERIVTIILTENNMQEPEDIIKENSEVQLNGISIKKNEEELEDSGIWMYIGKDSNGNLQYKKQIKCIDNGEYDFEIFCTDLFGNKNDEVKSEEFVIDKEPPKEVEISYEPENPIKVLANSIFGIFYNKEVTVTLSSEDFISGVDYFTYSIPEKDKEIIEAKKDKDSNLYKAEFSINPQFKGKIIAYSTDKAGNSNNDEKTESDNIIIDKEVPTAPQINSNGYESEWTNEDVVLEVSNSEALSGIDYYEYTTSDKNLLGNEEWIRLVDGVEKIDETEETPVTISKSKITINDDTNKIYYFRAVSNSQIKGNISKILVKVQKTIPSNATITYSEANGEGWYKGSPNLVITPPSPTETPKPSSAPIKAYYKLWNKSNGESEEDAIKNEFNGNSPALNTDGEYTIKVWTEDEAGNRSDISQDIIKEFNIDVTMPKLSLNYENNSYLNEFYYKEDRKLTVYINELHFVKDKTNADVIVNKNEEVVQLKSLDDEWVEVIKDGITMYKKDFNLDKEGDYKIEVVSEDIAGNIEKEISYINGEEVKVNEDKFTIDKTAPKIEIEYDNNDCKINENGDCYYNKERTATIKLTENNIGKFNNIEVGEEVELENISINRKKARKIGEKQTEIKSTNKWIYVGKNSNGDLVYEKKVPFEDDGYYEFEIYSKDLAGNEEQGFSINGEKEVENESFTIDKTTPKIEINYDNNESKNENYYKAGRKVKIKITDNNLQDDKIANVKINTARKYNEQLKEEERKIKWQHSNDENGDDVYTTEISYEDEGYYEFEIFTEDEAGNTQKNFSVNGKTETIEKDGFTIDKTKPQIIVKYDNTINKNENYYNKNRISEITIIDNNINDTEYLNLLVKKSIKKGKELTDISNEKNNIKWTHSINEYNQDVYVGKVSFEDDGYYELSMTSIDLAGNSNSEFSTNENKKNIKEDKFIIDKISPTKVKIDYKPVNPIKVLANNIFGIFYNKVVEVTLSSVDKTSDIDYFEYSILGKEDIKKVDLKNVKIDGDTYSTKFYIEPQYKGKVTAVSTDLAGNISSSFTDKNIIIDKEAPTAPQINSNGYENGKWTKENVVLEVSKSSALSGIDYYEYTTSDGELSGNETWTKLVDGVEKVDETEENPVTISKSKIVINNDTNKIYYFRAVSNSQIKGDISKILVKVQKTIPSNATITYSEANGEGWYKGSPNLVITPPSPTETPKPSSAPIKVYYKLWNKSNGETEESAIKNEFNGNAPALNTDGEYTIRIWTEDEAENRSDINQDIIKEFKIDVTMPKLSLSYDNNNYLNELYYKEKRVATISIDELNFEPSKVNVSISGTNNGQAISSPNIGGWSRNGNINSTSILFDSDGEYTISITCKDKADNDSNSIEQQKFIVDLTAPVIEISNVKDLSANKENVAPIIDYSDTNIDFNTLELILKGSRTGVVELKGNNKDIANGRQYMFEPIEEDDNYVLSAKVLDKAGNEIKKEISFSVNKNGSTFEFKQKDIQNSYTNKSFKPAIKINNVDTISIVSLTLNGKNVGYTFENGVVELNDEINKDGKYIINLETSDAAGNNNSMEPIEFFFDNTKPEIIIDGVENNGVYFERKNVNIRTSNNEDTITKILLNEKPLSKDSYIEKEDGSIDINLEDYKTYKLEITATDKAGNITTINPLSFKISNNILLKIYMNKPLFYTILGILVLALAILISNKLLKNKEVNEK